MCCVLCGKSRSRTRTGKRRARQGEKIALARVQIAAFNLRACTSFFLHPRLFRCYFLLTYLRTPVGRCARRFRELVTRRKRLYLVSFGVVSAFIPDFLVARETERNRRGLSEKDARRKAELTIDASLLNKICDYLLLFGSERLHALVNVGAHSRGFLLLRQRTTSCKYNSPPPRCVSRAADECDKRAANKSKIRCRCRIESSI